MCVKNIRNAREFKSVLTMGVFLRLITIISITILDITIIIIIIIIIIFIYIYIRVLSERHRLFLGGSGFLSSGLGLTGFRVR